MLNSSIRLFTSILLTSYFFATPQQSNAQAGAILSGVGGAIVAGEVGDELRESIDRAHAAASALIGQADEVAKRRLKQIDTILQDTVGGLIDETEEAVQRAISKATQEMRALEKEIVSDLKDVLWEAECTIDRSQDQIINQSLRGLLPSFLKGSERVISLPYPIKRTNFAGFQRDVKEIEIDLNAGLSADQVFSIIEEAYLESISNVREDDEAFGIISAYSNLSFLSRLTMCKFPGNGSVYWARKYAHYEDLLDPWVNILEVEN